MGHYRAAAHASTRRQIAQIWMTNLTIDIKGTAVQIEHLFVVRSSVPSRRRHYRLAGGRVKDAWRRRWAVGLCPVLDPAARSCGMAAKREGNRRQGLQPGS